MYISPFQIEVCQDFQLDSLEDFFSIELGPWVASHLSRKFVVIGKIGQFFSPSGKEECE